MDIEKLILDVTGREAAFENLLRERSQLLSETAALNEVLKKLSESEKRLNVENKNLRASLTTMEESFLRKYDYKNECFKLRKTMSKMESDYESALTKLQNELQTVQNKVLVDERAFQNEATQRQENFEATLLSMQVEKQRETQNITEKGQDERKRLDQTIRTKEAEIYKLKIDYEAKLKRMQDHIIKLQNNVSSNHTGTEIFRKKLQHERDTSSKRIAELECQLNELQSQLADSSRPKPQNFIAGYSRHIVNAARGSTSKRRKLN